MRNKLLISICFFFFSFNIIAQETKNSKDYRLDDSPFTIEFSYKIKWGFFDEFLDLYKKNHWPTIKSGLDDGSILNAVIHRPYNHPGEQDRWDLRITVTYKNALIAHGLNDFDFESMYKRLFPDKEKYLREEKRRFELIEEHMDVEIYEVSSSGWN